LTYLFNTFGTRWKKQKISQFLSDRPWLPQIITKDPSEGSCHIVFTLMTMDKMHGCQ